MLCSATDSRGSSRAGNGPMCQNCLLMVRPLFTLLCTAAVAGNMYPAVRSPFVCNTVLTSCDCCLQWLVSTPTLMTKRSPNRFATGTSRSYRYVMVAFLLLPLADYPLFFCVAIMQISKHKRHLDAKVVNDFWTHLEQFMIRRKRQYFS